MITTPRREQVINLIRRERTRQIRLYGGNNQIALGFGDPETDYPWLAPFSGVGNGYVERAFRDDYETYEADYGQPTWMHLIREEVAELFAARNTQDITDEAIQVAALCVSLCEMLLAAGYEGDRR